MKCKLGLLLMLTAIVMLLSGFAAATEEEPAIVVVFTGQYNGSFSSTEDTVGFDIVAAYVDKSLEKTPATVLLDCGDTINGSVFSSTNEGLAPIEIMNAAGYDAMTLGNHEFDFGYERLLELARLANFDFLTQPEVFSQDDPLSFTTIIERGGYKIGVFGLTTPAAAQISVASGIEFGTPGDLIANAKAAATSLRDAGADVVICLSHIGNSDNFTRDFGSSLDVAENVLGIDVIIDGHSKADSEMPNTYTDIYFTATDNLGCLKFYETSSGFDIQYEAIRPEDVAALTPDKATAEVIEKWTQIEIEVGEQIVGHSPVSAIDYEKEYIRANESVIANIVADAMRYAAETDVALINAGNIRGPLNEGDITWKDLYSITPYSNALIVGNIKGSDLLTVLQHSATLRDTRDAGGFLQVSGMSYAIDPDHPDGARVTKVTIDGKPLDENATYSVVLPDFVAEGGDGYLMIPDALGDKTDIGLLTSALLTYLDEKGETLSGELEGRILIQTPKDETNILLYGIIAAVVLLGGVVVIVFVRKRKRTNDSKA